MTKLIRCKRCGKVFQFSDKEQQFYAKKEYREPKKCPECRAFLKAQAVSPYYGLMEAIYQPAPYRRGRRQAHYRPRQIGQ